RVKCEAAVSARDQSVLQPRKVLSVSCAIHELFLPRFHLKLHRTLSSRCCDHPSFMSQPRLLLKRRETAVPEHGLTLNENGECFVSGGCLNCQMEFAVC